jgi:PAS domain S-box-containing protein
MSEEVKMPMHTEDARLSALYNSHILDTAKDPDYDNLTRLASQIFKAPFAYITLVDEHRTWIKSSVGLNVSEAPRNISFCQYTIGNSEVLEIRDALLDSRFADNPAVTGPPHLRFYAGAPLIDDNGFILGALCVSDIVPRQLTAAESEILVTLAREVMMHINLKRNKLALRAENLRLEEMLKISSLSPEIHAVLAFGGEVLYINDAVTPVLGYTIDEGRLLNFWDVCYAEDRARLKALLEEGLRKKQKQFDVQFRVVGKDATVRWFSWSMVTQNERWYSYGRDITEEKKVQNDLLKLSFVASKVNNAIVINDANNQVTWINDAFEKITGFTLEDIKGKRLGDLISGPDTDMNVIRTAREHAKENQSFTIDLLGYRKDKKPIWLSIYNTVIQNQDGNDDIEVEIIIDITEKKQAEREMFEAKEQALQLSEAKEMFLSVMSHEIRTPLNAVIGMSHLLLESDPKPSQVDDLNILKFSGENLLHIINDILDFTKIETGNLQLEQVPFSLQTLANDIVNSLQVNALKNSNQVLLSIDERIPAQILGDKTRMYQVLMNLLGNAIKFTDHGIVELNMLLEQDLDKQVLIQFEVKDNGIGIPEDKQSYIFESFTQAKTDISRKYGGTGLGLAITKKLLKLYKSDIHVYSVEGEGTTFSFSIALDKVSPHELLSGSANQNDAFIGRKVLVVDDNEINILIATRILSKWGVHVEVASNGHEAIDKVMSNTYDLILMDIRMPGIDGYETTSIIRELNGEYYKTVPIFALTASSLHEENSMFEACGMNGHLMKPFNPDDIKKILLTTLIGQKG